MEKIEIRWNDSYYPAGEWRDPEGQIIAIQQNFHCTLEDRVLIMYYVDVESGGGHGEGRFTARQPRFMDAITLEPVEVMKGTYVIIYLTDGKIKHV